jgi:uncharacterized pyridoxamine 5'-phosphate oxidase family protein
MRDFASSYHESAELEHPRVKMFEMMIKKMYWLKRIRNPFYKGINENANYPLLF